MEARILITAETLRRIARGQRLPAGIVEKDYAVSWFLKEIFVNQTLREAFLFKGGTALRKVYFPTTWRLSHDLDFTVLGTLKTEQLREGLDQVLSAANVNSGMPFSLQSFHTTDGSIIANIQFAGPLVMKNKFKMDITLDEKLVLEPEWTIIKTDYPDLSEFSVKVYSLKEVLIEKIRSMIQRVRSRDYYDVWRLLKENEFDMNEIRELLLKKCKINGIAYESKLIFDAERLREAEGYWKRALGELIKELPEFKEVVSELKEKLML